MNTEYETSSNNPYAERDAELTPIPESELPPAVKTGSLIALIAVLLATVFGSLLVSPGPSKMAQEEEAETAVTNSLTESTTSSLEPSIPEPKTPTTAVTESVISPDSSATVTTTNPDAIALDSSASTPAEPETLSVEATAEPPEPSTTATISTPDTSVVEPETPAEPPATVTETPTDSSAASPTTETATTSETTSSVSLPEIEATTSETTTAVDPSPLTTTESAEIASATVPDPAQTEQLVQTVYQTIDQAWTTTPVTGESVYRVKVNQQGQIVGFEPQSQTASENVDNTPLPNLTQSDSTATTSYAEFDVVFQPSGMLGVKPAQ